MRVQKSVGGVTYYVFCVLILRKDGEALQDSEGELQYNERVELALEQIGERDLN
jgi:hypothetical protein